MAPPPATTTDAAPRGATLRRIGFVMVAVAGFVVIAFALFEGGERDFWDSEGALRWELATQPIRR